VAVVVLHIIQELLQVMVVLAVAEEEENVLVHHLLIQTQ